MLVVYRYTEEFFVDTDFILHDYDTNRPQADDSAEENRCLAEHVGVVERVLASEN